MGKLIFCVLAVVIVWAVIKSYARPRNRDQAPRAAAPEDMVRCTHCGEHLPRSESHTSGEKFFCSEDHLRRHR